MITETARMAATALALAFLAESLTEYFFAKTKAAPYMVYIAPLLGIFGGQLKTDLFSTFMGLDGSCLTLARCSAAYFTVAGRTGCRLFQAPSWRPGGLR
jgi:hypothetical protein